MDRWRSPGRRPGSGRAQSRRRVCFGENTLPGLLDVTYLAHDASQGVLMRAVVPFCFFSEPVKSRGKGDIVLSRRHLSLRTADELVDGICTSQVRWHLQRRGS